MKRYLRMLQLRNPEKWLALQSKFDKRMSSSSQPEVTVLPEESAYDQLHDDYIRFCKKGVLKDNSTRDILAEFEELIRIPEITHLSFRTVGTDMEIMVGTSCVILEDHKTKKLHEIGMFIIIINRGEKSIQFENVTNPLQIISNHDNSVSVYNHPHIRGPKQICMTSGRQEMMHYLTEGRILHVLKIALRALWTIDSFPYQNPDKWPEVTQEAKNGTA